MSFCCPIYIVDDDADVRDALRTEFRSLGVECRTFATGAEFTTECPRLESGCVLLDVSLPADGIGVLRHIRPCEDRFCAVMISGSASDETSALALELGAVRWLEKPFPEAALLEAVEEACARVTSAAEIAT